MKKIFNLLAAIIITSNIFAQAPQKMSYQAVIRNTSNALVTNAPVKMRISILQGSATGTAVYSELHSATTNANGLVSIEIGGGTSPTGTFSSINWGTGTYFLKTETDPNNESNYTITGTSQLLSVPYALYAQKAAIDNVEDGDTTHWKTNDNNIYFNKGNVGIGLSSNNSNSLLYLRSPELNQNTLWAQGYVTENPGNPAIVTVRGVSDGGAVFEISKAPGAARNWAVIKMGVDGNLGHIVSSSGFIGISDKRIIPQGALDVTSNTGAFIVPRMTIQERDALVNKINGSIIYNTTTNQFNFYENGNWTTK
jgi:hypothetical protein